MRQEGKNRFLLALAVQWLQLIGILVLQTAHVLRLVQYKCFNGTELKKTFQQKMLLVKLLKAPEVMSKMSGEI